MATPLLTDILAALAVFIVGCLLGNWHGRGLSVPYQVYVDKMKELTEKKVEYAELQSKHRETERLLQYYYNLFTGKKNYDESLQEETSPDELMVTINNYSDETPLLNTRTTNDTD